MPVEQAGDACDWIEYFTLPVVVHVSGLRSDRVSSVSGILSIPSVHFDIFHGPPSDGHVLKYSHRNVLHTGFLQRRQPCMVDSQLACG